MLMNSRLTIPHASATAPPTVASGQAGRCPPNRSAQNDVGQHGHDRNLQQRVDGPHSRAEGDDALHTVSTGRADPTCTEQHVRVEGEAALHQSDQHRRKNNSHQQDTRGSATSAERSRRRCSVLSSVSRSNGHGAARSKRTPSSNPPPRARAADGQNDGGGQQHQAGVEVGADGDLPLLPGLFPSARRRGLGPFLPDIFFGHDCPALFAVTHGACNTLRRGGS